MKAIDIGRDSYYFIAGRRHVIMYKLLDIYEVIGSSEMVLNIVWRSIYDSENN